ncbi:MAG: hypothetical protein IPO20_14155 [Gammaproteobacteria bacterium]|nr:hypothetical protein [Gammaproteobacteria bacterium]
MLERELCSPRYVCEPITLGASTDPISRWRAGLGITQRLLEGLRSATRNPYRSSLGGSALVLRDTDNLARMAARGLCRVMVSVTTLDDGLKRRLGPRTASGATRARSAQ